MMNGLSDGMVKVLEVLGERVQAAENMESWARKQKEDAEKELAGVNERNRQLNIEVSDLKKQLFEANEKIRKYEEMVIIDNDGKLLHIKDLPEIEVPEDMEKEIQASLDCGVSPEKDSK
jgi:predicted nuclease with TOPRIM domain